jgi:hypothetical protein
LATDLGFFRGKRGADALSSIKSELAQPKDDDATTPALDRRFIRKMIGEYDGWRTARYAGKFHWNSKRPKYLMIQRGLR